MTSGSLGEVVGREALVAQALRALETQSVLLIGPRGRGVSTALGAVAAAARTTRPVLELDLTGLTLEEQPEGATHPDDVARFLRVLRALDPGPITLVLDRLDGFGAHGGDPRRQRYQEALLQALKELPGLRLVVGLEDVDALHPTLRRRWLKTARPLMVAPLGRAEATELALRQLRGCGLPDDRALADHIATLSAGAPLALAQIVAGLDFTRLTTPEDARMVLNILRLQRGDPAGLATRVQAFEEQIYASLAFRRAPVHADLLNLLSSRAEGIGRDALVAELILAGHRRGKVQEALRELELHGWLVEVDGVIRFEHPWLLDVWVSAPSLLPDVGDQPDADDDIPF